MLDKLGKFLRKILPLGNDPKQMLVLFLFVLAFLLFIFIGKRAFADEPGAQKPYLQFSTGRAMVRGQTSALNLAWTWPSPQRPADMWVTSITLIGTSEFRGFSAPNNFAFDVNYVTGYKRFDIGLGPSWMINPYPYNGARVNFSLQAGYRFERWPVTVWWKHYSCGGACTPNFGRDMALIGYRF